MSKQFKVSFTVRLPDGTGTGLQLLLADALSNFIAKRTPAVDYVEEHYQWMMPLRRKIKVEQVDARFYATDKGQIVTEKLVEHFPKIMDLKFTSYMEDELDKIEEAHLDWVHVLREFYEPFKELLDNYGQDTGQIDQELDRILQSARLLVK